MRQVERLVWKRKKTVLDPLLLESLNKSEEVLKKQYGAFTDHYQEYLKLNHKVEEYLDKMKSYQF